ncbi:hypothetical protein [Mycoplasma todarodis]|uniref:hypothetical protein n=1 Tax=Mycoplasma todarodis TaxID=1937191 RepID=UPI003B369E67
MKTKHKLALGFGTLSLVSIPLIGVVSCGKSETIGLKDGGYEWDGVSHKMIDEDLTKTNEKISYKLAAPKGDSSLIKELKAQKYDKFYVDSDFVWNPDGVFQRSPKTILPNTDGVKDINDLDPKKFGMTDLQEFVKSKNGTLKISLIEGTEDDTNGTLAVRTTIEIDGKQAIAEYLVDGFPITKDIILNGDSFSSIKSIINALNDKTHLDFEKKVSMMTPQDLKNELIDLYNETYGGRLTIIGTYNGKKSAVALDRNDMLKELIYAFGNVSKRGRYENSWVDLAVDIAKNAGKINIGNLHKLFADYSNDMPTNADKDDIAGLVGNLPADVINMFPSLLTLFSQVANGVKTMPMVIDWAKNTTDNNSISESNPKGDTFEKKVKDLDHILVRWVLKTGKWK